MEEKEEARDSKRRKERGIERREKDISRDE